MRRRLVRAWGPALLVWIQRVFFDTLDDGVAFFSSSIAWAGSNWPLARSAGEDAVAGSTGKAKVVRRLVSPECFPA